MRHIHPLVRSLMVLFLAGAVAGLAACQSSSSGSSSPASLNPNVGGSGATSPSGGSSGGSGATSPSGGSSGGSGANPTTPAQQPGGEVKVGLVSPFSGTVGFLGEYMKNSVQVEIDKLNDRGGLLGKKITLVTRDDGLDPAKSLNAARELVDNEKVSLMIGPSFTTNYLSTKQYLNQSKVATCLPTVADDAIKDAPYTFRTQDPRVLDQVALAKWIGQSPYKKVAILTQNDALGKSYADDFPKVLQDNGNGATIVATEFWQASDQDYTPQVQKIKAANPDLVFIPTGNSTLAARAIKAAQNLDFRPQFLGISGMQGYTYPSLSGEWANNSVFIATLLDWSTGQNESSWPKGYREHVKAVVDKFGVQTQSGVAEWKGTALAGDCIVVWSEAVKRANSFDGADVIQKGLNGLKLTADQTAGGVPADFSNGNREMYTSPSQLFFYKWEFKDGKWLLSKQPSVS